MANRKQPEGERYVTPMVDIYETKDDVVVLVDLPGVSKDGLGLTITEDELTITAAVSRGIAEEEEVLYGEMAYADYFRAFTLSDAIDRQKVSASLENGVLTLTLPKVERVKPRQVPVTFES